MPSGTKTFVVEYRPNGGGRGVSKRRLTIGRYGPITPEKARTAAKESLAKVRLGGDPAAAKAEHRAAVTVSALIDVFITRHVEPKCKPSTVSAHRGALEHLRKAYGATKAENLKRPQIGLLHAQMRDRPFGANRFLAVISKCFEWGALFGLVPEGHNPASRIERFHERQRERFLTSDELAKLGEVLAQAETVGLTWAIDESKAKAKHAPKPENRRRIINPYAVAAIRLLVLTGARLEILHAKWEYFDLERGILHLPDSKTGKKPIYLSSPALVVLSGLDRVQGNPYILPGEKEGQPRSDLKKPWEAITIAAGLSGLRLPDLRHSFASVGAGSSLGLPIIGKLLGHSKPATTARYAHLDADPMRRAANAIGATISAAMAGTAGSEPAWPIKKARSDGALEPRAARERDG